MIDSLNYCTIRSLISAQPVRKSWPNVISYCFMLYLIRLLQFLFGVYVIFVHNIPKVVLENDYLFLALLLLSLARA